LNSLKINLKPFTILPRATPDPPRGPSKVPPGGFRDELITSVQVINTCRAALVNQLDPGREGVSVFDISEYIKSNNSGLKGYIHTNINYIIKLTLFVIYSNREKR